MRKFGLIALLFGFTWLVWQVRASFVQHQYVRTIWQIQHLPAGDSISRSDAAKALHDLSSDLKDYQQHALLPASVMLVGGLLSSFARRKTNSTDIVYAWISRIKSEAIDTKALIRCIKNPDHSMIELIFLSPLLLVIVVALVMRFGVLKCTLHMPCKVTLAVCAVGAFFLPMVWGVWIPDMFFAPQRTLATATSPGGYSFRVVQYWNRVDLYSTELHVTSPASSTEIFTLDGDDSKSWSVPLAVNEASRVATVTLSGNRTKDIRW